MAGLQMQLDADQAERELLIAKIARTNLKVMVDKPGPDNTGVLPKTNRVFTNYNEPGTVGAVAIPPGYYEDLDFYGDCYPADPAGIYEFHHCVGHGGKGHPTYNRGCFFFWSLTTGWATFEDCTIAADDPSFYRDGIVGHRVTVRRCDISHTNDGIGINKPGGSILEQNWVHDQVWWKQDPAHTDGHGTHNDPIQIQCGKNTVRGNTLQAFVTADPRSTGPCEYPTGDGRYFGGSAIMISEGGGPLDPDTLIDGNWLEGGYAQVNVNNNKGASRILKFKMGINRYGRLVRENYPPRTDKRWICLAPNGGDIQIEGLYDKQIWNDGGGLLTVGRATGIRVV